eukprot:6337484-Prymnesium_polylepis.1
MKANDTTSSSRVSALQLRTPTSAPGAANIRTYQCSRAEVVPSSDTCTKPQTYGRPVRTR